MVGTWVNPYQGIDCIVGLQEPLVSARRWGIGWGLFLNLYIPITSISSHIASYCITSIKFARYARRTCGWFTKYILECLLKGGVGLRFDSAQLCACRNKR
jgi:hypothetical protein